MHAKILVSGLIMGLVFAIEFDERQLRAAESTKNMVASVNPIATDAGVAQFALGGNAVDAAIAAALTLGIVDGHNSGIGGSCFILIRTADGQLVAIDGREMAPAKATRDMFVKEGKANSEASQTGPLAAAVPGALAAYHHAVKTHGRRSLKDLLLPAAEIAERGFVVDRVFARTLKATADRLTRFEGSRRALFKPDGSLYAEGETLRLPDLARTYQSIAEHGPDWFYRGPFAVETEKWMAANGGIMTAADFSNYRFQLREPLVTSYRGLTVVGFPPPSSGGVHVAQMLQILEAFNLRQLREKSEADWIHVVIEAMKLAFADRAFWLGDADFAKVPRGLIAREYAAELAKRIDPVRATRVTRHGEPPNAATDLFLKHTTHVTAADEAGNWVAITATLNTSFGSKVVVPGTGVMLNNQMDDFSIQPGVPNSFGLLGAEANAIEPGKRPLSSMSPTIILKDGQPIITVGAAGGPTIISQVLLAIIRQVDFEMPVDEALAAPRFHHQWSPDVVLVEERMPETVIAELKKRGHEITLRGGIGVSQGIGRSLSTRTFRGSNDPRVPGKASGN